MNNIFFERLFILYLLFNIGGWIYFGFLQYYLNFITSDNCNYYYNELIANKILIGIIMSLVTLNTINTISIYKNNEFNNLNLYFDTFIYPSFLVSLFLTITGIIGLVIFIKSDALTNIYCSDNNAFFGIQLSIYGTIWISIIEIFYITFIILSILCNIIKDSKLHLLFFPCYDIYNKYKQRRIEIDNNNINNEISIPITALKEKNKILCSICYDSSISLLLEPCNHICICELCYNSLVTNNCPICKKEILSTKKVYLVNYSE